MQANGRPVAVPTAKPDTPNRKAARATSGRRDARGGVSGRMTSRLVRLFETRGHDARALCERAGVSLEEVTSPSARIPYATVDDLVEACVDAIGTEGFAVALSNIVDEHTYDAAGLVLITSATFGEGLERAFTYQRLWADGPRFSLHREGGSGIVEFKHPGSSPIARAVLAELAFVETMNAARILVRGDARAARVTFAHPRGSSLLDALGVEPSYDARRNSLTLDASIMNAPVTPPEGTLAVFHEALARQAMGTLPTTASVTARLRALCNDDPSMLQLDLAGAAKRLRLAGRTLQRRLANEGTSWSEIVDGVRRARVRELDLRSAPEKDIAFLVGFADPSALARARARWASLDLGGFRGGGAVLGGAPSPAPADGDQAKRHPYALTRERQHVGGIHRDRLLS